MTEVNLSEQPHVDHSYNPSGLGGFSMESFKLLEDSSARLYVPTHAVAIHQQDNPSLESRKAPAELPDGAPNQRTTSPEVLETPETDQQ